MKDNLQDYLGQKRVGNWTSFAFKIVWFSKIAACDQLWPYRFYNIHVCVPHIFYSIDNLQAEPEATVEDSIPSNSSSISLNIPMSN